MAYIRSALHARDIPHSKTSKSRDKSRKTGRSWLARLYDSFMAARTRQAEREIERYLRGNGGKFTDDIEREIERRFLSHNSRW